MPKSRVSSFAIAGAVTLATLALSHELIYLAAHGTGVGYTAAMNEGGHDPYWTSFLLVVATTTGLLLAIAGIQLRRLRRLAADVEAGTVRVDDAAVSRYLAKVWTVWRRLAIWVVLAYFVQENVETVSVGTSAPGILVLARGEGIALPILLAVSLLVAAIRALVAWRRQVLLARIKASSVGPRRPAESVLRPSFAGDLARAILGGRRNGVRAPPMPGFALA